MAFGVENHALALRPRQLRGCMRLIGVLGSPSLSPSMVEKAHFPWGFFRHSQTVGGVFLWTDAVFEDDLCKEMTFIEPSTSWRVGAPIL